MIRCPVCQEEISKDAASCPACGTSVDDAATRRLESPRAPTSRPSSFDSIDDARFVTGTMLAGRYRIVGLLGKGGMGEVSIVIRRESLERGLKTH